MLFRRQHISGYRDYQDYRNQAAATRLTLHHLLHFQDLCTPSYLKIPCLCTSYTMTNGSLPKHHTATTDAALFKEVVEDSFRRGLEYEVTQTQKATGETFGWIVTTSPEQLKKLNAGRISILGELLRPTVTNKDHLSQEGVVRRNCLVLIIKGLNLNKTLDQTTEALKTFLGEKNVSSVYYPRAKPSLHSGIVNLECLNAHVYKHQVHKSAKICGKWVEFQPHPNSLDGSAKPNEETLRKYGFSDITTALANTVVAL